MISLRFWLWLGRLAVRRLERAEAYLARLESDDSHRVR
jgi:hypothetical protein